MRKYLFILIALLLIPNVAFGDNKTVTVKPSGGDYTSLQAAITGELAVNANLTAGGMNGILTINIGGEEWLTADTTAVVVDGFTTDATHYLRILTNTPARALKTGWSDTRYRLSVTDASAITVLDNHVRIEGLQIEVKYTEVTEGKGINFSTADAGATAHVGYCRIRGDASTSSGGRGIAQYSPNRTLYLYNTIIERQDVRGIYLGATCTSYIENCIIYGGEATNYGIDAYGTAYIKNCAVFNTADDFNARTGSTVTIDYCASDDNDGTNNVAEVTWAANFPNYATGDFTLLNTGALYDAGDTPSIAFNDDIDQVARAQWSVGVDEYETPSSSTTTTSDVTTTTAPSTSSSSSTSSTSTTVPLENTHYIRSGATDGDETGADWTNAWLDLPSTFTRGHTYYIADGSYGTHTFSTAESGTTYIYIKKATPTAHGTDTGWVNNYGDGQAEFVIPRSTTGLVFSTGYWEIDGVVGNNNPIVGASDIPYGIKITCGKDTLAHCYAIMMENAIRNVTFKYIDIEGAGPSTTDPTRKNNCIYSNSPTTYITISHCYLHDTATSCILTRGVNHWVFEYSTLGDNKASADAHAEGWSHGNDSYNTVRYSTIRNVEGTGLIAYNAGSGVGDEYYGNLFYYDAAKYAVTQAIDPNIGATFAIGADSSGTITNFKVYNNTFVRLRLSECPTRAATVGAGCEFYNNVFLEITDRAGTGNTTYSFGLTHDYNAFEGTFGPTETHKQSGLTTAIFTNYTNDDFSLATATSAGVTLASPYDEDKWNVERGDDGVWDRGAYEYDSGAPAVNLDVPVGIDSSLSGADLTVAWTAYDDTDVTEDHLTLKMSVQSGGPYLTTFNIADPTDTSCVIEDFTTTYTGRDYYFVLTASDALGNESANSHELHYVRAADLRLSHTTLTAPTTSNMFNVIGRSWRGFSFTTGEAGFVLKNIILRVYKYGSPTGDVTAYIYADNAGTPGLPTGSALATSQSIDASDFYSSSYTTNRAFVWNFSGYTLAATTKYHVVFNKNICLTTDYVIMSIGTVAGQTLSYSTGGAFEQQTADRQPYFEMYGDEVTTSTTTSVPEGVTTTTTTITVVTDNTITLTAPVSGEEPDTTAPDTSQYAVTNVRWYYGTFPFLLELHGNFAPDTVYYVVGTATVHDPDTYSFVGVAVDHFTVSDASETITTANTGIFSAAFPATEPDGDVKITDHDIGGVTAPVLGATPVATAAVETATGSDQYTVTSVTWGTYDNEDTPTTFAPNREYSAYITLTVKEGYSFLGVAANAFNVPGATDSSDENIGDIIAKFPATAKAVVSTTAVTGVTAPAYGNVPVTYIYVDDQIRGLITWSPNDPLFVDKTVYTATITLTPGDDYTLTGTTGNQFTVSGAAATNDADAGIITAIFPATHRSFVHTGTVNVGTLRIGP